MMNPVLTAIIIVVIISALIFVTLRITRVRSQSPATRVERHVSLLPKSNPGKWSVGLAVAFVIAFVVFVVFTEVPDWFWRVNLGI